MATRFFDKQVALVAAGTVVVAASADHWPAYRVAIWGAGIILAAVLFYLDTRKPWNYKSFSISDQGFTYEATAYPPVTVSWPEISEVYFSHLYFELDQDHEDQWEISTVDGLAISVLLEWPHKKAFVHALQRHLPGFIPPPNGICATKGKIRHQCYSAQRA